jgi:hypothetical protein
VADLREVSAFAALRRVIFSLRTPTVLIGQVSRGAAVELKSTKMPFLTSSVFV